MRGHLPYRGEVHASQRGHASPPHPNEKLTDRLFWLMLIAGGVCLGYVAVRLATPNLIGFFGCYLLFFIILIVAFRDLQNIKMITPDLDERKSQTETDKTSLVEDYFAQIEWMHTHRGGRLDASRWDAPEPPRSYQIKRVQRAHVAGKERKLIVVSFSAIAITVSTSAFFGSDSPAAIAGLVVSGLICMWFVLSGD